MFDIGWSELLVVLVVALVVVGPKDLPRLMRTLGRWVRKARTMADDFRANFDEMARETELDELRSEIEALRNQRPLAGLEADINRSILPPETAKPDVPPAPAPEPQKATPESEPPAS